eukprot:361545_1
MAHFILVISIIICESELLSDNNVNQYETDNISYWRSLSHFKPTMGKSYGKIQLRKEFEIKFKLICHSIKHDHPNNEFENIFRIGKNGLDYGCNCHGARYPAIYVDTKMSKFEFAISDESYCWRQYPFKSPCEACLSVDIGYIYHFYLKFNETIVKIEYKQYKQNNELIKRDIIYEGSRKGATNSNHLCRYQDIIISDPLNVAADVTLWDIEVRSFDTNLYCKQWEKYKNMHQDL